MDLHLLKQFVAVAETEHLGRAAARLHVSPSPLSRRVRELEQRLGLVLFDRRGRRLKLSAVGRSFLADARELLQHADRTEARARALAEGRTERLQVGFVDGAVHAGILPRAAAHFAAEHPRVRLELRVAGSDEQLRAVRAGEMDVAVIYGPPERAAADPDAMEGVFLCAESFTLVAPSGHDRPVGPTAFISSSARSSPRARQAWVRALRTIEIEADVVCEVKSPHAALRLVEAGLGCALVQSGLVRAVGANVRSFPVPEAFPLRMELSGALRGDAAPLARAFLQALVER